MSILEASKERPSVPNGAAQCRFPIYVSPKFVRSDRPSALTCNKMKNDKMNCSEALRARLGTILSETISGLVRPESLRLACHQEACQIILNTTITLMRDCNMTGQNNDLAALVLSHVLVVHVTWRHETYQPPGRTPRKTNQDHLILKIR